MPAVSPTLPLKNNLEAKGNSIPTKAATIIVKTGINNCEKTEIKIQYIGKVQTTLKHIILLQNDRGTSYGMYIKVQNELVAAYNELRNEFSNKHFGKNFDELNKLEKKVIRKVYPNHISEAEPKNI